jgi:hypothetical protein
MALFNPVEPQFADVNICAGILSIPDGPDGRSASDLLSPIKHTQTSRMGARHRHE